MARGGVFPSIELDNSEREAPVDSTEIAINFVKTGKIWDRTLVNLDVAFCFHISQYWDDDCDLTTVAKARSRSDWSICGRGEVIGWSSNIRANK